MLQRLSDHLWQITLRGADQLRNPEKVLRIRDDGSFPPSHPTTRLCLDLLREVLSAIQITRLLDVGCGSGVLGLAAAALGVPLAVSLDIEARAAKATRDNARDNHLAGAVQVIQGSTGCVRGGFDLILANLPWEVQMDKAGELERLASPHGSLILSGFHDNQEKPLLENYRHLGWSLVRRLAKEFQHPELPPHLSFTWVAWTLRRSV
jgi:ribosomal protein L11 methyltransferase